MPPQIKETVYNIHLSEMLKERLPGWPQVIPEATRVFPNSAQTPDVLVEAPGGLPVVLECKFDKQTNVSAVEQQAECRLGEQTDSGREVEQAIAVLYPEKYLREHPDSEKAALESAELRYAVYSKTEAGASLRFPSAGWLQGPVSDLADFVENVAVSEQKLQSALTLFANEIEAAANILGAAGASSANLGKVLNQEPGEQTNRMAMAILLNALVFQTTLPQHHPSVKSVDQLVADAKSEQRKLSQGDVLDVWQHILNDINYWPVFAIATDILYSIGDQNTVVSVLESLAASVSRLSQLSAQTVQDLAGQIFGKLISDRKFLATFYTLPASATLLAELAVSRLDVDWGDSDAVTSLKIADFACGTGALLSAAYRQVRQRVRRHGMDDRDLHRAMLEDVLIGADIMPAAVHITAAMLSSVHPGVKYTSTLTHVMPYGDDGHGNIKTGSLHLIEDSDVRTLWGDGSRALTNLGEVEHSTLSVSHGEVDLVIMNPPFTSSTGDARKAGVPMPAFAGFATSKQEQSIMKKELDKIRKNIPGTKAGHGNAGLGSDFIDLAIAKVKLGGVIAFVLPSTFAAGEAWENAREAIARKCRDVCVVSIASGTQTGSAFSADTAMAEVLVVATRREENIEDNSNQSDDWRDDWRWVTLTARPKSPAEAVEISKLAVKRYNGEQRIGETYDVVAQDAGVGTSLEQMKKHELMEIVILMEQEAVPSFGLRGSGGQTANFKLCRLEEIGDVGPSARDINEKNRGPFDTSKKSAGKVHYPILWYHKSSQVKKMLAEPDMAGKARQGMGRKAEQLWESASHLQFTGRIRFNSQRMAACFTEELCLGRGDTWFSIKLRDSDASHGRREQRDENKEWIYPVVLWSNTTLGLLSRWAYGTKQQPGRNIITKSRLPALKVLNPAELSNAQIKKAKQVFDDFKTKDFLPANEAYVDDVRIALDEAVFVDLLAQPSEIMDWLKVVRDQWCREPTVHGGKTTQPPTTPAP